MLCSVTVRFGSVWQLRLVELRFGYVRLVELWQLWRVKASCGKACWVLVR